MCKYIFLINSVFDFNIIQVLLSLKNKDIETKGIFPSFITLNY